MKKLLYYIFVFSFFSSIVSCGGSEGSNSGSIINNGSAGYIILVWEAPTTNEDGTQLADLAGYKIYYGSSSSYYTIIKRLELRDISCQDIGGKIDCSYKIENLPSGTWYFVVTAFDTSGNESQPSNEVSKIIR